MVVISEHVLSAGLPTVVLPSDLLPPNLRVISRAVLRLAGFRHLEEFHLSLLSTGSRRPQGNIPCRWALLRCRFPGLGSFQGYVHHLMSGTVHQPHLCCFHWSKTPAIPQPTKGRSLAHHRRRQWSQDPKIAARVSNRRTEGIPNLRGHRVNLHHPIDGGRGSGRPHMTSGDGLSQNGPMASRPPPKHNVSLTKTNASFFVHNIRFYHPDGPDVRLSFRPTSERCAAWELLLLSLSPLSNNGVSRRSPEHCGCTKDAYGGWLEFQREAGKLNLPCKILRVPQKWCNVMKQMWRMKLAETRVPEIWRVSSRVTSLMPLEAFLQGQCPSARRKATSSSVKSTQNSEVATWSHCAKTS